MALLVKSSINLLSLASVLSLVITSLTNLLYSSTVLTPSISNSSATTFVVARFIPELAKVIPNKYIEEIKKTKNQSAD